MDKITVVDKYIGEILQLLDTTCGLLRDLKNETGAYKQEFNEICDYMIKLWDLREKIYDRNPQMEQFELYKENMQDKQMVNRLNEILSNVNKQYKQQNFQTAYELSKQLLNEAQYGHFKRIAEAMLFLCQMKLNKSFDHSMNKKEINIIELEKLYQSARQAENKQDFVLAKKLYEELTRIATFSQYELSGQAGIYRCINEN